MNNSKSLEKEFFKFIYDRHLIWYKRFVLKEESPWTEDKVLKTYKIINVYRELDKGTKYIIQKLKGVKDREKLLINIIFYRFFNQFNLYEKLGVKPFNKIDEEIKIKLVKQFEEIKKQNRPIFNNAYLISSGKKGKRKHISILNYLKKLNLGEIINQLDKSRTPRESLEVLQKIPMIGPFLACEIWTDLTYFNFFKQGWKHNDFVNISPGAKWSIDIVFNQKLGKNEQAVKLKKKEEIPKSLL